MPNLEQALDALINQFTAPNRPSLTIEYDEDWPSACYLTHANKYGDEVTWQPIKTDHALDVFDRISQAMGFALHADLVTYYSRYWSSTLDVTGPWGELGLLQLWNEDDAENLRGNLIGHFLQQKRMRLPSAGFIAIDLNDDNQLITLDNETGAIFRENIHKKRRNLLANSCTEFISQLNRLTN